MKMSYAELGYMSFTLPSSSIDAEHEPEMFTTAPAKAITAALKRCDLSVKDIDLFEVNEAFAVVCLANMKLTGIEHSKLNILGGGCSLGS